MLVEKKLFGKNNTYSPPIPRHLTFCSLASNKTSHLPNHPLLAQWSP
jgi:hypothetical protein